MDYIKIYDELKALNTRAFSLSNKDKEYIKQVSKYFNIEFVERKKCVNCYADQLVVLLIELKKHLSVRENINCKYEVISNKDVIIRGRRINNETITDEIAEWLIKNFPNYNKYIKLK